MKMDRRYVIVRSRFASPFAGELVFEEGLKVVLKNARRLWYWDGAASLSQLAQKGTSKPGNCKFPCAVDEVTLTQAIEILSVTPEAEKSIQEVKEWKA
jgi:hypothetical protein